MDDLKNYCYYNYSDDKNKKDKDDMTALVGLIIRKIVFEDLDMLYEYKKNEYEQDRARYEQEYEKGENIIPDDCKLVSKTLGLDPCWLIDCIFENYMDYVAARGFSAFEPYYTCRIENCNNDKNKWLEKIVINTVKKFGIQPIYFVKYFSLLRKEKLDHTDFDDTIMRDYSSELEIELDSESIVSASKAEWRNFGRYFNFYRSYIRDHIEHVGCAANFDKDHLALIFLVLFSKELLPIDKVASLAGPETFLFNLNPKSNDVKKAIFALCEAEKTNGDFIFGQANRTDIGDILGYVACYLNEEFITPIWLAISESFKHFLNIRRLLSDKYVHFEKYAIKREIPEEQKLVLAKSILSSIDKVVDEKKLDMIAASADLVFDDVQDETISTRLKAYFNQAFENYVVNGNCIPYGYFYNLMGRLVKSRKIIGLSRRQLKIIKEIAEIDEYNGYPNDKDFEKHSLLELFNTDELKEELNKIPEHQDDNATNLEEDNDEKKGTVNIQKQKSSLKKKIKIAKSKSLGAKFNNPLSQKRKREKDKNGK